MIKEENCSGVPESEYKLLADKLYLETLTTKDPQMAFPFYLHHVVPILWESPKFDAMTCQLADNKLVNNTKAAIASGIEHPIGSKAAKKASAMKDVDFDTGPDGDAASMKESDRSWTSAMNDVKIRSKSVAAALEEENSLLSKGMKLHCLWKLQNLYDKKEMVEKAENLLKRIESTLTALDDCDGDKSSESDN